ncbi:MAG: PD40 domain-containing protein [Armatimonadetes bacterium]|nr:PD40 domain-containing protein [Armatimonadota bacterium]
MLTVKRGRGLSLLELLVAVGIIVLMLGLGVLRFRSPDRSQGPGAAASVVAEALRAARAQAISGGVPVGIAFPSADGTTASSQSFYRLEGQVFPRITSVSNLAGEYPQTFLSVVQWPVAAGNQTAAPPTSDDFLVDAWGLRFPRDYTLIFLPSGQVVSNGLTHFDAAYHVLVSSGIEAGGGAPGGEGPGVFDLAKAAEPYTVSVTTAGMVRVTKGIEGSPALASPDAGRPLVAAAPPLTGAPEDQPEILGIDAFPKPLDDSVTTADALVPKGGRVSIEVQAWSPEGADLYCEWSGPGDFSTRGVSEMTWDPVESVWRSRVEWVPPADLESGDEAALQVRVEDEFGNRSASVGVGATLTVEIADDLERLIFDAAADPGLWVVQEDGSGNQQALEEDGYSYPQWSPDGSCYVVIKNATIWLGVPGSGIVSAVTAPPAGGKWKSAPIGPRWSPDGTRILFGENGDLFVIRVDGSGLTNLTTDIATRVYGGYAWSPNGDRICYTAVEDWASFRDRVWVMNADGTGKRMLLDCQSRFCNWSPDGQWIAIWAIYPTEHSIVLVSPDAAQPIPDPDQVRVVWTPAWRWYSWTTPTRLGWSPDSKKVSAFMGLSNAPDGGLVVVDIDTGQETLFPDVKEGWMTWGAWARTRNKLAFQDGKGVLNVARDDGTERIAVARGSMPDWSR